MEKNIKIKTVDQTVVERVGLGRFGVLNGLFWCEKLSAVWSHFRFRLRPNRNVCTPSKDGILAKYVINIRICFGTNYCELCSSEIEVILCSSEIEVILYVV